MTSDRIIAAFVIAGGIFTAAGCVEDNSIEDGLVVHVAEVHVSARPGAPEVNVTVVPGSAQGGYDPGLERHPIRDVNGRTLALYRTYLVVDGLELTPCTSLARLPGMIVDGLFPAAHAHAGHGTEPVGGRALDQPNVIDIVTQEGFILPLGDKLIAPGRYCGIRVALVRLAGEAYGMVEFTAASTDDPTTEPGVPDLSGRMFVLRADYCAETDAGQCTSHVKVDIDDGGLPEPAPVTLELDPPIVLNDTLREAYVTVGIAHGEWVQNVDVTLLGANAAERQKLLDNIVGSLHVNSSGLGALPANIPQ